MPINQRLSANIHARGSKSFPLGILASGAIPHQPAKNCRLAAKQCALVLVKVRARFTT
jgi:hypothetical protein